jgi:hypothetical protein
VIPEIRLVVCAIAADNVWLRVPDVGLVVTDRFECDATLNSANHGHVLTRKLALLFFIAKQVLERKTMNFRFEITNSRFSRTIFTMRQIHPERKYLLADVPTYRLKVH